MNNKDQINYGNRILNLLQPQSHHKVLEIGFGNGRLLEKLAPLVYHVTGIDIEEKVVTRASQRLDFANLMLKTASAESLPFEDASFDQVICSLSYHEFADASKALAEIRRVLKPLGRLLILDPDRNSFFTRFHFRFTPHGNEVIRSFEELRNELLEAGFSEVNGKQYRIYWLFGAMWLEGRN